MTKMSMGWLQLQKRMPLARVVYASATGVTELSNLAYCERLGLWGEGCPFRDFEVRRHYYQTVAAAVLWYQCNALSIANVVRCHLSYARVSRQGG